MTKVKLKVFFKALNLSVFRRSLLSFHRKAWVVSHLSCCRRHVMNAAVFKLCRFFHSWEDAWRFSTLISSPFRVKWGKFVMIVGNQNWKTLSFISYLFINIILIFNISYNSKYYIQHLSQIIIIRHYLLFSAPLSLLLLWNFYVQCITFTKQNNS